jgi:C4-dicarboxylate-specific signal transduction histidine kinase
MKPRIKFQFSISPWRFWRLEMLTTGVLMSALILAGGRAAAQIQQVSQSDREERRVERRMDTLQRAHDDLRFEIERRLVRIETYVSAGTWLLGGIGLAVLGQLGKGLFDLIVWRRDQTIKNNTAS